MTKDFKGKTILVTGGTGFFGSAFTKVALERLSPKRLVIFSRDEFKQHEMAHRFNNDPRIRMFLGDVRDRDRLYRAFNGIDIVIHAAALKQIPAAEYNPFEFIKTNVIGAQNVIDAAIDRQVEKVVALSSDKAANPVNLYGASKLCADKLFVAGNSYATHDKTRFSVVRYGNVMGSRGSVVPRFLEMKKDGVIKITDPRMTRFWITIEQGIDLVFKALTKMRGGEIFVPKLPSMKITDLANVVAPGCKTEITGIRPGEKLHEVMISKSDSRNTIEYDSYFVIKPAFAWWSQDKSDGGKPMQEGTEYSSDKNTDWLSNQALEEMLQSL